MHSRFPRPTDRRCGRVTLLAGAGALILSSSAALAATPGAFPRPNLPERVAPAQAEPQKPVTADQLKQAIDEIKRRVAKQQEGRAEATESNLAAELKSANDRIVGLNEQLSRLRAERDTLATELGGAREQLGLLATERRLLEERLRATEARLAEATAQHKSEVAALREERSASQRAADEAQRKLAELERRASELTARVQQVEEERNRLDTALTAARNEQQTITAQREQILGAAQKQVAELERTLAERQRQSEAAAKALEDELAGARQRSAELEKQVAELNRSLADTRKTAEATQASLTATQAERAKLDEQLKVTQAEAEKRSREQLARIERSEKRANELQTEMEALRSVAQASVAEVQSLGEQLLRSLGENQQLLSAFAELRQSKELMERELVAARRDADHWASETHALRNQLAGRQVPVAPEAVPMRSGEVVPLAAERSTPAAPERPAPAPVSTQLAAIKPPAGDADLPTLVRDLAAVETGDGWLMTMVSGTAFRSGSEELIADASDSLGRIAKLIEAYGPNAIRIVGHTDSFGDAEVNRRLSLRRAESVRSYLVTNQVLDGSRIATEGMGEDRPIASNDTVEGRRANRRVEVYLKR